MFRGRCSGKLNLGRRVLQPAFQDIIPVPISARTELLQHILLPLTGMLDHLTNGEWIKPKEHEHHACSDGIQ
jgi:hypothetical protein